MTQLAIVGGGPAGLAVGIEAALRGLSVIVLERQTFPVDKACGEGLMPSGLAALQRLGVIEHLDRSQTAPFDSIRYVQEDGRHVDGRLPAPRGLGVRRLALSDALASRARQVGVELREGAGVRSHSIHSDKVTLQTDAGDLDAQVLVAADGLNSPLRRALGLQVDVTGAKRFGLRRHLRIAPWGTQVEVHFADGVEAYVTPVGSERVGIAFLWNDEMLSTARDFDTLLERFPQLKQRVGGAPFDSEVRGAGPLRQQVRALCVDRAVLVGDAAGYIDAITGEGLSLAFEAAHALGECLPDVLARGGERAAFASYEATVRRDFARYARLAGALVWVSSRPALRRQVINRLIATPSLFDWGLRHAL